MMKVLIVDDLSTMRRIISNMVKEILPNAIIREAENGKIALDMLKKENFSLILTDWNMPEMDGLTLLKHIKEEFPSLIVLMITAEAKKDNIIMAAKLGADGYIVKPFTITTLKEKITHIFNRKNINYD